MGFSTFGLERGGWRGVGKGVGEGLGEGRGGVGEKSGRVWLSMLQNPRLRKPLNVPWN